MAIFGFIVALLIGAYLLFKACKIVIAAVVFSTFNEHKLAAGFIIAAGIVFAVGSALITWAMLHAPFTINLGG